MLSFGHRNDDQNARVYGLQPLSGAAAAALPAALLARLAAGRLQPPTAPG